MHSLTPRFIALHRREREMKVAARNEALQHAAEELQKRIEQKVGIVCSSDVGFEIYFMRSTNCI